MPILNFLNNSIETSLAGEQELKCGLGWQKLYYTATMAPYSIKSPIWALKNSSLKAANKVRKGKRLSLTTFILNGSTGEKDGYQ